MRVCVVGLGTIGTPTIRYIQERGFEVVGYDLTERSMDDIKTFADWKKVPKSDVYVVTVSSDNVENACKNISNKNKNPLVSIESTIPVGACRKISKTLNLKTLVHCPHRYWVEDPINHGIRQPRVIGAVNKQSLGRGLEFYKALDIPLHVCPTIETAEMCKIAENAYRFVQIAFSEELRTICEEKGISFDEVREACNTKWNIEILEARDGISGSCLPQDIGYLKSLSESSPLLKGAISTDKIYKKRRKSV
jgi:UDP-N-acetyl-D-mannosaminuronate dehydrogenase